MEAQGQNLLFVIGNPLLDVSVEVKQEFIDRYGLKPSTAILAGEEHKAMFEEMWRSANLKTLPGGAGMNTCRAANFLLKDVHPNSCIYFGSIAADKTGEVLQEAVKSEGVDSRWNIDKESYTGQCGCAIIEKERSLVADLGACLKYPTPHLKEHMDVISQYKFFYASSFFFTSNTEAFHEVSKYANENGIPFAFNLAAEFLITICKNDMDQVLQRADYVFGNEHETDAWAREHNIEFSVRSDITKALATYENPTKKRIVVTTQGAEPTLIATYDPATGTTELKEYPVKPLAAEKIVDVNGAGDSFVGGFISQIVQGKSIETAVEAGTYLAQEVIQRSGCAFPEKNEFSA